MSTLRQRMEYYKVPGVSVAVFEDGEIAWAKGYGVTQAGGTTPVTARTLFQAASISKPVAAVGALLLVQDGKLSIDQNVNERLTTWRIPENQFLLDNDVTLRQLLSHGAGVNVHGFPGYPVDSPLPALAEILDGLPPANTDPIRVAAPIGRAFRYSGGGYTIVQQMIIDVSGLPFAEYMAEAVLQPLGMVESTFVQPLPDTRSGNAATGHLPGLGPVDGSYHVYPEMAAAGLWTTASDLARFAIGLFRSANGKDGAILGQSLAAEVLTIQTGNYGLGLELAGKGASGRFSHGGVNAGFDSMLVAYPSSGSGAVVMTNANLSFGLINEIMDSIARVYRWPDYPLMAQQGGRDRTLQPAED